MDMAGNAIEWCSDRYQWDYYTNSPSSNPTGSATGDDRVMRGSAWNRPAVDQGYTLFRCALRDDCAFYGPAGWSDDFGFRCVSPVPGP